MPGFNKRGPMGEGPMTGRRMGRCANPGNEPAIKNSDSKAQEEEFFKGRGFGFGRRRGVRGRDFGLQNRFRGGR